MYILHFVCPFIYSWTWVASKPLTVVIETMSGTLVYKYLFKTLIAILLVVYTKVGVARAYGNTIFNILRNQFGRIILND